MKYNGWKVLLQTINYTVFILHRMKTKSVNMHKKINMNRLKFLILLLIPLFLLSACSKQSEEDIFNNAKAKIEEAKKLEAENKQDEAKKAYNEGIEMLKKLISDYPSSPKVPD